MKKSKDHLNFDLEFLDKKEPVRAKPTQPKSDDGQTSTGPTPISSGYQYNWKGILIVGGIVLFIGWAIFSDDSGSSSSTTNTYTPPTNIYTPPASGQTSNSDDSVIIGDYSCSRYHYNQAVALNPDESEAQMTAAQNALMYRGNALERLQNEMATSDVSENSSQWELDQYNEMVDDYNSKLPAYNLDVASLDSRIDRYNTQIEAHNNYLRNNCSPKR